MRSYALTELGRKTVKRAENINTEEMQLLRFIRDRKLVTEDEIEMAQGDKYVVRHLVSEGYVMKMGGN